MVSCPVRQQSSLSVCVELSCLRGSHLSTCLCSSPLTTSSTLLLVPTLGGLGGGGGGDVQDEECTREEAWWQGWCWWRRNKNLPNADTDAKPWLLRRPGSTPTSKDALAREKTRKHRSEASGRYTCRDKQNFETTHRCTRLQAAVLFAAATALRPAGKR